MTILSNCHTHTEFCDGKSSAEEMVQSAIAHGFRSIGFTSHAAQHFDLPYAIAPEKENAYLEKLAKLRQDYGDRIRVWSGIERDFFSCAEPGRYDYYIASVHYIPYGGRFYAVDGDPEDLQQLLSTAFHGDGLALVRAYYSLVTAYAESYHPPVIGHFDLIKKNNRQLGLFDPASEAYQAIVHDALEIIAGCGCLLEVNTGGMARGYVSEPYPSGEILRFWHALGGGVIPSSDCHDAAYIQYGFDRIPEYLRQAGFENVTVLGCGETLFESYPLSASQIPRPKSK